jgi:hypothetical protein
MRLLDTLILTEDCGLKQPSRRFWYNTRIGDWHEQQTIQTDTCEYDTHFCI